MSAIVRTEVEPETPGSNATTDLEIGSTSASDDDEVVVDDKEILSVDDTKDTPDIVVENGDNNNNDDDDLGVVEDNGDNDNVEELEEIFKKARRRSCLLKILFGMILLGVVIYIIVDSSTTQHVKNGIVSFLEWIKENPAEGAFLFIIVYFLATILFVPGSILTLGAGFTFAASFGLGLGVLVGTLVVFIGAALGSIVAFLIARYLLREQVRRLTKRYAIFEAIDSALEGNGLKIFILLRLSPVIPFNVFNYIGGVTSVTFRDYTLALFAMIPGTVLFVFLGASAGGLAESAHSGSDPTVTIIVVVVGAVLGIATIWLTTRYARKELNRILEDRRREEDTEQPHTETLTEEEGTSFVDEDNGVIEPAESSEGDR